MGRYIYHNLRAACAQHEDVLDNLPAFHPLEQTPTKGSLISRAFKPSFFPTNSWDLSGLKLQYQAHHSPGECFPGEMQTTYIRHAL